VTATRRDRRLIHLCQEANRVDNLISLVCPC
jgi:hypothetical protein